MVRTQSLKNKVKQYFKYFFWFQFIKGIIWLLVAFTGISMFM